MPGQAATVSRKMARLMTLSLLILPKRYPENVSKDHLQAWTAASARRSLALAVSTCSYQMVSCQSPHNNLFTSICPRKQCITQGPATKPNTVHAILTIGVNTHFLYGDNFFCTPDGMHYTAIGELALRFDLGDAERMRIG